VPLVLIAEDEAPIAEVVAEVIKDLGCEAIVATHGKRALELARERWPALVLTDLMMPFLDGVDLIAELRRDARERVGQPFPVVIIMTAAGLDRAKRAGADAVLRKPFDISTLEDLIRRLLGLST
jgi:CheY-like chemotaxis protein